MPLYTFDEAFSCLENADDALRYQISEQFEKVVKEVGRIRFRVGGFTIVSANGTAHVFLSSIKRLISKEFYLLMLTKIRSGFNVNDSDIEVSYLGSVSSGLTLCSISNTALLGVAAPEFNHPTISCVVSSYEKDDVATDLKLLAFESHTVIHREFLENWGFNLSDNYKVFVTAEFYGVIYPGPKEHNPPHVHIFRTDGTEFAKYQIDNVKLTKGVPDFDQKIIEILTNHNITLMAGWDRSQKGELPYKIDL